MLLLCRTCTEFFFFFQAEDGIRDADVTGVQTCALPISSSVAALEDVARRVGAEGVQFNDRVAKISIVGVGMRSHSGVAARMFEIGRASGRERGEISVVAGSLKKKKEKHM